jgi:hypothetical protein
LTDCRAAATRRLTNEAGVVLDGPHPSPKLVPPLPGGERSRAHWSCHLLRARRLRSAHGQSHGHSRPPDLGALSYRCAPARMVRMQSLQSARCRNCSQCLAPPAEPGALEEGAGQRVPLLLQRGHTEALVSRVAMRSRFPTEASLTPTLAVLWRTCSKPSLTPLILTLAVMCNSSMSTSTALPTRTLLPCRRRHHHRQAREVARPLERRSTALLVCSLSGHSGTTGRMVLRD